MIQNLNIDDFLKNYWQQKPLLIRSAFPNYQSPISPEELAGLACEDFVESRIILEQKTNPKWILENGPFSEESFPKLPESHWTLLIQGLNKIFPEFNDLLHKFDFIPSWRVDDLMASFAAPEGSVGPHIDQYDVFLLQASGRRKWMISEERISEDNFESNTALKIIKDFSAESEWVLEAGDMLYLPPNVAHYGIGMENCMTFSIGFRAPSHAELLSSYIDEHITSLPDELRYQDPLLAKSNNSGEISSEAINNIQKLLLSHFNDKSKIESWFGKFITEYLDDENEPVESNLTINEFLEELKNNNVLRRPATIRANYIKSKDNSITLYINGATQEIQEEENELAMLFCNKATLTYQTLQPYLNNKLALAFLCKLYNSGFIEFDND